MQLPIVSVIMAGGMGERFWPISRQQRPKQLLYLTNDSKIMLEEAVNRLMPLIDRENILIATNENLQEPIRHAMPHHPPENIIGEPLRRNTTGCLAYAAAHALARFEDQAEDMLISVTTADHLIGDDQRFQNTIAAALQFAEEEDALVIIGVHPTRPETGYGYVEISELNKPITERDGIPIYKVSQFLEKPNQEDAERYQASRFYYWNSGMFFWRLSTFLKELEKSLPEAARCIPQMKEALQKGESGRDTVQEIFATLPDISIDYALMEKAQNVYVALGDFRWDDVGAWDALARFRERDPNRNTSVGDPILIDCKNVTAFNEPGSNEMAVCAIGLEDMIVVTSKDGVLVCPKDRAQDVKKAVEALKQRKAKQI